MSVAAGRAPARGPGSVKRRLKRFGSWLEPGWIGLGQWTVFFFFIFFLYKTVAPMAMVALFGRLPPLLRSSGKGRKVVEKLELGLWATMAAFFLLVLLPLLVAEARGGLGGRYIVCSSLPFWVLRRFLIWFWKYVFFAFLAFPCSSLFFVLCASCWEKSIFHGFQVIGLGSWRFQEFLVEQIWLAPWFFFSYCLNGCFCVFVTFEFLQFIQRNHIFMASKLLICLGLHNVKSS